MQTYFVAETERGKYVGLYSVDAISAMVSSGEISRDFVATLAIDGSYCDVLKMRDVSWIKIADLVCRPGESVKEANELKSCDGKKGVSPFVVMALLVLFLVFVGLVLFVRNLSIWPSDAH